MFVVCMEMSFLVPGDPCMYLGQSQAGASASDATVHATAEVES